MDQSRQAAHVIRQLRPGLQVWLSWCTDKSVAIMALMTMLKDAKLLLCLAVVLLMFYQLATLIKTLQRDDIYVVVRVSRVSRVHCAQVLVYKCWSTSVVLDLLVTHSSS